MKDLRQYLTLCFAHLKYALPFQIGSSILLSKINLWKHLEENLTDGKSLIFCISINFDAIIPKALFFISSTIHLPSQLLAMARRTSHSEGTGSNTISQHHFKIHLNNLLGMSIFSALALTNPFIHYSSLNFIQSTTVHYLFCLVFQQITFFIS